MNAPMRGTYRQCPDVIVTDLDDELILLDPRNGEMFGLNACGRRVWLTLATQTVPETVEVLCSEFDVVPERANADVQSLLASLVHAGLVAHVGDAA